MNEKLPIVEAGLSLNNASEGEMTDPYEYFDSILSRLKVEQPALFDSLDIYIKGTARDDEEVQKMLDVMTITYRTLEAQAETDALKDTQVQL